VELVPLQHLRCALLCSLLKCHAVAWGVVCCTVPACQATCNTTTLLPSCCRYYLSNQDAYRLKLLLPLSEAQQARLQQEQDAEETGQQLQSSTQLQQIQ
jgi:hypothetical protein